MVLKTYPSWVNAWGAVGLAVTFYGLLETFNGHFHGVLITMIGYLNLYWCGYFAAKHGKPKDNK